MDINYIKDMFALEGKNILVTGCASGIGREICNGLSLAGANIAGFYNETSYKETESLVEKNNKKFYPMKVDLNKISNLNISNILIDVEENIGPISILINNAGINLRNMAVEYLMEDWDKVFNINLKSAFFISKEFALYNIQRKAKCKIIHTASLLGYQGGYRSSAYTASKHGVIGITKLLSNEWGQYGINVNCVVPGYIKTKMTEEFINNTQVSDRYLNRIPLGYWGKPEDIIGAVLFLASKASDYITGATVVVDGGYLNT